VRSEYDLSAKKGVRGKYYRAYRYGHSVRIAHIPDKPSKRKPNSKAV
jgi:hypothetical protein